MKLARLVSLLAVGLALSFAGTACRKGVDKVTNIPGQPPPTPRDDKATQLTDAQPVPNPNPPENVKGADPNKGGNLPQTRVFDDMNQDREAFAAETIHFDFDKSNIRPSEVPKLEKIAQRMKSDYQGKFLRIEGYCDERGTEEYNRALGDRRALSAREFLAKLGLNAEDIQAISFGEDKPVDPGHNEAAWAKNRRCEFILLTPK